MLERSKRLLGFLVLVGVLVSVFGCNTPAGGEEGKKTTSTKSRSARKPVAAKTDPKQEEQSDIVLRGGFR